MIFYSVGYALLNKWKREQQTAPFSLSCHFRTKFVYRNVKLLVLMNLREDEGGLPVEDSEIQKVWTINCLLCVLRHRFFFLFLFNQIP